eukprot:250148-Amphidinium_carterae.1
MAGEQPPLISVETNGDMTPGGITVDRTCRVTMITNSTPTTETIAEEMSEDGWSWFTDAHLKQFQHNGTVTMCFKMANGVYSTSVYYRRAVDISIEFGAQ